jgi:hypothetical protein
MWLPLALQAQLPQSECESRPDEPLAHPPLVLSKARRHLRNVPQARRALAEKRTSHRLAAGSALGDPRFK